MESAILKRLTDILEQLNPERKAIASHDHFQNDLGMDSLMLVELSSKIRREFGIRIRPMQLYDLSTLQALSVHLESETSHGP